MVTAWRAGGLTRGARNSGNDGDLSEWLSGSPIEGGAIKIAPLARPRDGSGTT